MEQSLEKEDTCCNQNLMHILEVSRFPEQLANQRVHA